MALVYRNQFGKLIGPVFRDIWTCEVCGAFPKLEGQKCDVLKHAVHDAVMKAKTPQ